jgi:hypothetical protein
MHTSSFSVVQKVDKSNDGELYSVIRWWSLFPFLVNKAWQKHSIRSTFGMVIITISLRYIAEYISIHDGTESELLLSIEFCFLSAWSDRHNDSSFSFWFFVFSNCFFNRSRCSYQQNQSVLVSGKWWTILMKFRWKTNKTAVVHIQQDACRDSEKFFSSVIFHSKPSHTIQHKKY